MTEPDSLIVPLTTGLAWDDLGVAPVVGRKLEHLSDWLQNRSAIVVDQGRDPLLASGFRVLFHGPPGTGKTLSAALLGKRNGLDIFRVDLSRVVSKYIGETEKHIDQIFARVAKPDQVLFFDEADALFGKWTRVVSAHERFANQEVSYFLKKIEDFPGVVILSATLRGGLEAAFARRFQMIVEFDHPDGQGCPDPKT